MGPYVGGGRLPDVMKLTTGHQGKARIKTSAPVLDESLSFLEGYLGIDFFFSMQFWRHVAKQAVNMESLGRILSSLL